MICWNQPNLNWSVEPLPLFLTLNVKSFGMQDYSNSNMWVMFLFGSWVCVYNLYPVYVHLYSICRIIILNINHTIVMCTSVYLRNIWSINGSFSLSHLLLSLSCSASNWYYLLLLTSETRGQQLLRQSKWLDTFYIISFVSGDECTDTAGSQATTPAGQPMNTQTDTHKDRHIHASMFPHRYPT